MRVERLIKITALTATLAIPVLLGLLWAGPRQRDDAPHAHRPVCGRPHHLPLD